MTPAERNALFRDAALARLASPERLDTRLALPGYSRRFIAVLVILLAVVAAFSAWLLAR